MAGRTRYTIAYDIADDTRRRRVAALLEGLGHRVQESVFECTLNADELRRLRRALRAALRVPPDRCRLYRLCAECAAALEAIGEPYEPAPLPVLVV